MLASQPACLSVIPRVHFVVPTVPDHFFPYFHLRDPMCRDVITCHLPRQWEAILQCNLVSHWLGAYTKSPLIGWAHTQNDSCDVWFILFLLWFIDIKRSFKRIGEQQYYLMQFGLAKSLVVTQAWLWLPWCNDCDIITPLVKCKLKSSVTLQIISSIASVEEIPLCGDDPESHQCIHSHDCLFFGQLLSNL